MLELLIYISLLIAGIFLVGLSIRQYKQSLELIRVGQITKATVVEIIFESSDDMEVYRPVFQYTTIHNEIKQLTYPIASYPAAWKVGQQATLIYHPQDAEQVKWLSYWGMFTNPLLMVSLALPLIVIGGGYCLYCLSGLN
jgi:hypothetical protein